MTSVAVSPKFQIVIPKAVRRAIQLQSGQRVDVRLDDAGRIIVEPQLDIRSARGFVKPVAGIVLTQIDNDPEGPDWPGGCDPLPNAPWVNAAPAPGDK